MPDTAKATLYRMALPDHLCPFGIKARQLLLDQGFEVDDRVLETRAEVEALKREYDLISTPLIFIDGARIGGCDDLERHLLNA